MTRTPPCCCDPVVGECALLFMRVKVLGDTPVFSTPDVTFWTKKLIGYTGMSGGWFVGANGLTGCTCEGVTLNLDGITLNTSYCNNIGIDPEYRLDKIRRLATVPGDDINWYGKQVGVSYTPQIVVMGSLILPEKYKGITLQNSIEENENLYYRFPKGVIPPSLTPFIFGYGDCTKIYNRQELDVLTSAGGYTGTTAGTNINNTSKFKVFYSDDASVAIRSSKDIFFSVDHRVEIPTGYWFREGDETGGSPMSINGYCFNVDLRGCNSIPYAYFQSIPETIYLLTVNIAKCQDNEGSSYISVTDTTWTDSFVLEKAVIGSDATCFPTDLSCVDDLKDDYTVGSYFCIGANVGDVSCPIRSIGKGTAYGSPECSKKTAVPCDPQSGPCASLDCNAEYPLEPQIIEVVRHISIREINVCDEFPGFGCVTKTNSYRDKWVNIYSKTQYEQNGGYVNCGKVFPDPGNFNNGPSNYKYFADEYECRTYEVTQQRCTTTPVNVPLYQRDWGLEYDNDGNLIPYDILSDICPNGNCVINIPPVIPTNCGSNITLPTCCCCPPEEWDCPTVPVASCCSFYPDSQPMGCTMTISENAIIVKIPSTTTWIPNPYLMYNSNSDLYFDLDSQGVTFPNYGKYLKHYRDIWVSDRIGKYPYAASYQAYAKNPKCGLGVPDYFLFNESSFLEFSPPNQQINCQDTYKRLPNYDTFCQYSSINRKAHNCRTNIKHKKLEDFSFKLACNDLTNNGNTYGSSVCWKHLNKYWDMNGISYSGICNEESQTLRIQMPKGITLNDCTDILSWNILSAAPKIPKNQ